MNATKSRSMVLPVAVALGFLLHARCGYAAPAIPYMIFAILLLNYSAVDVSRLRPSVMDAFLAAFQTVFSIGPYLLLRAVGVDEIISQGVMMIVLCPVAASSVVIACMLGADRERVTAYTIIGNLLVTVLAPLFFSLIGAQRDLGFASAFWLILRKVSLIIAAPLAAAVLLRRITPGISRCLSNIRGVSFYLWAVTLTVTLGQTIHFIIVQGADSVGGIVILGAVSAVICAVQFTVGKMIGKAFGDTMAGGQLLGQKNVAMGVWMANTFLNPLSSVGIALYSIWQNLFNSWQMLRYGSGKHK